MTALNVLPLDAKFGEIWNLLPLIDFRRHFQETSIATLPLRLKPRHLEQFWKCPLKDVEGIPPISKTRSNCLCSR